jgi:hypothetical protein|tara:strand:- start:3841 stop:4551 length:711 start_codon:yes stop_codon:yes gene_type:complete
LVAGGGSVLVGVALWGKQLYNNWKPRRVGIYGASMVGKTTLDKYMTTPGEMEEIPEHERTKHFKIITRYVLPKPTRKRLRWEGERRVIHSADIGGEERFWNLWIDDMVTRQCEYVIFMFDDRAFNEGAIDQIGGFKFLVDSIISRRYRYRNFRSWRKGKRYVPRLVVLIANKSDRFFDNKAAQLWQQGRIGEHKIFDPFRDDLIRLQKAGIPTKRNFMATRIGWNVEQTLLDMIDY